MTLVADAQAFAAYRKDERLAKMVHLREQSVLHSEILVGEDGDSDRTAR